jgi:hypothetical protein
MCECRQGARIPVNGITRKDVTVEVGVEIGLMVNVDVECVKDEINRQDAAIQVKEKVSDIFHIDGQDKVLNNVCIYAIQ